MKYNQKYEPDATSGKALSYRLDNPDSIPSGGDVKNFLHSFLCKIGPGAHSTSYKMSTWVFPGVKMAECRTRHLTSS